MNIQARIKHLERTHTAKGGTPEKVVVWNGAISDGELDTFDGVKMTHAEAEVKAAAQPESVLVIHVIYASQATKDGDE